MAVPLSIKHSDKEDIRDVICFHNHCFEDHVLLLSTATTTADNDNGESTSMVCDAQWEHQPTTGDVPSSRHYSYKTWLFSSYIKR